MKIAIEDIKFDEHEMIAPRIRLPLLQTPDGWNKGTRCTIASRLEAKSRRWWWSLIGTHWPAKAAQLVLFTAAARALLIATDFH